MNTPSVVIHNSIEIHASPSRIWALIVSDSRSTEEGFGCRIESDWDTGAQVIERVASSGAIVARGTVLACEPERILKFSIAAAGHPDTEPGTIGFNLSPRGTATILSLTVDHEAFMASASQQQLDAARAGWETVLGKIKALAESKV